MATSLEEKGLTLQSQFQPEVYLSADVLRLEQLFINLLMNSMAYTDSPGVIDVRLSQQAKTVILTINDTKPCASIEECEHLFEPLYRQDRARTRRGSCAGLGLTTVRILSKRMMAPLRPSHHHWVGFVLKYNYLGTGNDYEWTCSSTTIDHISGGRRA
ncbi:ATP-binding protein [Shewanella frigidimarina]|uniref:ATP-binding protein n=1 Tax=Shewanella frigidimarina TaxID=56812 RepID=UPI003D7923C2